MEISQLITIHPSIIYAADFKTIISPLEKLGITYFSHVKISNKGHVAAITSDPDYLRQYCKHACYNFDLHMSDDQEVKRYLLWDIMQLYGKTEQMYKLAWNCGLSHFFTLIQYDNNIKNLYHFATKPGRGTINSFYLQHIDLLENFIEYFKQQLTFNNHLKAAYQLTFPTSRQDGGYFLKEDANIKIDDQKFSEYLAIVNTHKTNKLFVKKQSHITHREQQCASYLVEGYTAKEIANKLSLSPRTIEVYLERLRIRFDSKNKTQLIQYITESNLLNQKAIDL